MPELQIVMRGREHALQITFTEKEHTILFAGDKSEEHRVEYHGSGAEGFYLTPTTKRSYSESTSVKFLEEGERKRGKWSRCWINVKFLKMVKETRPKIQTQSKQEGPHTLYVTPIRVANWEVAPHISTELIEKRQEQLKKIAPEVQKPAGYQEPASPGSSAPKIHGDVEAETRALSDLLEMVARCNHLSRRSGEIRFEIDNQNRIVVLKVFRPGNVRLRDDHHEKEGKNEKLR